MIVDFPVPPPDDCVHPWIQVNPEGVRSAYIAGVFHLNIFHGHVGMLIRILRDRIGTFNGKIAVKKGQPKPLDTGFPILTQVKRLRGIFGQDLLVDGGHRNR